MSGTLYAILRAKRATSTWFSANNPILKNGEIIHETDIYGFKIGDGVKTYQQLPYFIPPKVNNEGKYLSVQNGNIVWSTIDTSAIWTAINQKQDIATLGTDVANLGFIKNSVNDLINYYTKTETYTKSEVNSLISGLSNFHYEIYASTSAVTDPSSNVLYLIGPTGSGSDKYEEYVYNNTWTKIGDTSIDLSGYVTLTDLNTELSNYTTTTDLTTLLNLKQNVIDANNKLDYSLIDNQPTIPSNVSELNNDSGFITLNDVPAQIQSDWNQNDNTQKDYIKNKPSIPAAGIPAGGNAGQVLKKISSSDYDVHWANSSETLPSAYCTTSGGTAAKVANCSLYVLQNNQYLQVLIGHANTYQGALTLNINSAGAKPIYINGTASSASNYTLPNGTYFVFYDGTKYYFRTDGKLTMPSGAFGGSYNDLGDKPTLLTNYDFEHVANATVNTSTVIINFAQNKRCSQMITVNNDIGITIGCNNSADNYIWIKNAGSSTIDVTINNVIYKSTTVSSSNIHIAGGNMTVDSGSIIEIGIICNSNGVFITSRNDL